MIDPHWSLNFFLYLDTFIIFQMISLDFQSKSILQQTKIVISV